ncbi:MAG: LemA family protein [Candidatus Altimarinota bacterium]
MKKTVLAVLALVVLAGIWLVGGYNSLVSADLSVDESWAQVQVQYQRRFDLIPNLVETVRGVADFERSTYEAVTAARSAWAQSLQTGTRAEQIAATGQVDSALSRLLVTVENYPQLRAQENFSTLQAQIEGTENRVATARRDFNAVARAYNQKVRSVPSNMIAAIFGFEAEPFFESSEGSDVAPQVQFVQ